MKMINAVVTTSKSLELLEDVSLPSGTRVRIEIVETDANDTYIERLNEYYRNRTPEMRAEERALAEELSAADTVLPEEDPWW